MRRMYFSVCQQFQSQRTIRAVLHTVDNKLNTGSKMQSLHFDVLGFDTFVATCFTLTYVALTF